MGGRVGGEEVGDGWGDGWKEGRVLIGLSYGMFKRFKESMPTLGKTIGKSIAISFHRVDFLEALDLLDLGDDLG